LIEIRAARSTLTFGGLLGGHVTVEDVEKGLERAWRLVAPPLVNVVILGLLVALVAPALGQKCVEGVRALGTTTSTWGEQRSLLEFLGLAKLIPVISLIVVVSVLLLLQKATLAIGYYTPGRLAIHTPENYAVAFQPERLLGLWLWFPKAEDLGDLVAATESWFNPLSASVKKSHSHWEASGARATRLYYTAKFYILAVLLFSICELIAGGSVRWLAAVSCLLTAAIVAVSSLHIALNAHLQTLHAVVNAVEADLLVRATERAEATSEVQQEREAEVHRYKSETGWWELQWFTMPAWRDVRALWAGRRRAR
jgi:hypothetical protein